MKKLLIILLCIPLITFSQENFIDKETNKEDYISTTKSKVDIDLRKEASLFSKSINQKILKGSEVIVLDFKNNFWLIKKDTIQGWSPLDFIYKTSKMYSIVNNYKENDNIKKFGLKNGERVNSKKIWIGMTKEMLLASYGSPNKKNINNYGKVTNEQWIYNRSYIYLENDIVTAIQSK